MGSKWILGRVAWRVWIHLAQDRDRWKATVNTVMDLPVLEPQSCWGLAML
jgi:ABC-type sulfate transport system permease component